MENIIHYCLLFFKMNEVNNLLEVNNSFKNISFDYRYCDVKTRITNLKLWRKKFPNAIGANISGYKFELNTDIKIFESLRSIEVLNASATEFLFDSQLKYCVNLKILNIVGSMKVYGDCFCNFKNLKMLIISDCNNIDHINLFDIDKNLIKIIKRFCEGPEYYSNFECGCCLKNNNPIWKEY